MHRLKDSAPERRERTDKDVQYSFVIIIIRDLDGWFVADVPELRGCHTQARTLRELWPRVREVVELCLADEAGEVTKIEA